MAVETASKSTWNPYGGLMKKTDIKRLYGLLYKANTSAERDEIMRNAIRFSPEYEKTVFENLRINIPIKTDETFMFQLLGKPPEHLEYGNMYSWDTNLAHRVFPTTDDVNRRVHLVLGFSPWFDYNEEEDSWTSNEFFGELHPIDMLLNGHVHDSITGSK